jgi:hypothetical protein
VPDLEPEPAAVSDWVQNYFNYFTEIEEHFQRARGTGLFLLSPVDWALIESWKQAEVPLEAVLRGIDAAFEKWRSRKSKIQMVNSLTYCAQAVLLEAQRMAGTAPPRGQQSAPPFTSDELRDYLTGNAGQVSRAGLADIAEALERLAASSEDHLTGLEELEQRLTALEEKMVAALKAAETEEQLFAARQEMDRQLRPYRSKMTAEQLAMLERQYLERRLLEKAGLPRLSLFYMR